METNAATMDMLKPDETGTVKEICCGNAERRRLFGLGLVCGTRVTALFNSPCGGAAAYRIRGAVIALRNADCANIILEQAGTE